MPTRTLNWIVFAAITGGLTWVLITVDAFEQVYGFTRAHEDWNLDEILIGGIALVCGGAWMSFAERRRQASEYQETEALREALEALHESEILLESIFENAPVGLLIKGPDHVVTRANATYLGWYGLEHHSMTGHRSDEIEDFQPADDAAFMNDQETAVLETGQIQERQVTRRFADGKLHTVHITKFPVHDRHGKITKVGSVSVDLTEQIEAQRALAESEQRFKDFADVASDWFWEMNADLRFTYFSPRNEQVTGFGLEAFVGKTRWEISEHLMDDLKWAGHWEDLDARRPFTDFEYELLLPDGVTRHVSISGKPVFDGTGEFQGYRGIGSDITERSKTQSELAKRTAMLERAETLGHIGHWSWNLETDHVYWSDEIYRIHGLDHTDEARRGNPIDYYHDEDREVFRHHLGTAKRTGKDFEFELRLVNPDGRIRHIATRAFGHRDRTGKLVEIYGVFQDISARKEAEGELRKAKESAEIANQAKSQFLAAMSHDLRTPLNAILGFSEVIMNQYFGPPLADKYKEYAHDIHSSARHLLEMLNDLLDISAIEAGKHSLNRQFMSVGEVISDCIHTVGDKALTKSLKLKTDVPADLPHLYADQRAIKQILLNLLSNAVKFTPDGGSVAVRVRDAGAHMEISVTDTGCGIPAANLADVINPFTRSERDPFKTDKGWGLGLAITKSLIDLHGGNLDIESEPEQGTTVRVTLPQAADGTDAEPQLGAKERAAL